MVSRSISNLRRIEDLSRGASPVHRLHPLAKLLATVAYLAAVASMPNREVVGLLPFALFPVLLAALADVPASLIMRNLAAVSPLVIGLGALNPLFDRAPADFGGLSVPGGWLVFASLAIRCALAVSSATILVATTGMDGVGEAMRALGAPKPFVLLVFMTYRYLGLLAEEVGRSMNAYALRACGRRFPSGASVGKEARGSLPGRILVRTYERGLRIYDAMLLRGFEGEYRAGAARVFRSGDFAFVSACALCFAAARFIDLVGLLGGLAAGRG